MLYRNRNGLHAILSVQFSEDIGEVERHGSGCDKKLFSDIVVGHPLHNHGQNFDLAIGKVEVKAGVPTRRGNKSFGSLWGQCGTSRICRPYCICEIFSADVFQQVASSARL